MGENRSMIDGALRAQTQSHCMNVFVATMPPPPPFIVHTADHRTPEDRQAFASSSSGRRSVRLVQWNVERGYKLDDVLATLRTLDADVLALQECDFGCARSSGRDVAGDLAAALHLNLAFLSEFDEIESPLRSARDAGGGAHGQAILTKFDFAQPPRAILHPPAIDWDAGGVMVGGASSRRPPRTHTLAAREPRRGGRVALVAALAPPGSTTPCLHVYSAHLEVFCGVVGRLRQLASLFDDVRGLGEGTPVALLGDLNTITHSIVRLSPHYSHGRARWSTLGRSEATWLAESVVDRHDERALRAAGVDAALAESLRNPGLACPFPPDTVTLANAAYTFCGVPLVATKLDWCLLRGVEVSATALENEDYHASDHKAMVVDGELVV